LKHAVGHRVLANSDPSSGIDICQAHATYHAYDTAIASVTSSSRHTTGKTASNSDVCYSDQTNPTLTVSLARAADHNGWYNHAVENGRASSRETVYVTVGCVLEANYSGPDRATASVRRSSTDTTEIHGYVKNDLRYGTVIHSG